jgi:hypothetical protein
MRFRVEWILLDAMENMLSMLRTFLLAGVFVPDKIIIYPRIPPIEKKLKDELVETSDPNNKCL